MSIEVFSDIKLSWKSDRKQMNKKTPPQPLWTGTVDKGTVHSTRESNGKKPQRTLVLLYKLFESCDSSVDTAAHRDGVIRGNDLCQVYLSRNLTWLVKAGDVSMEGWKPDSFAWTWKESRSLLFFIIFVSVLNFEFLLIVDSYLAI